MSLLSKESTSISLNYLQVDALESYSHKVKRIRLEPLHQDKFMSNCGSYSVNILYFNILVVLVKRKTMTFLILNYIKI